MVYVTEQEISRKVKEAKIKVLDMCVAADKGHVTTAFSCAEIVAVLYYAIMHLNPANPQWVDRDRFVMSKNHGSVMTYPIMADLGYFDKAELQTFMKDGTRLGGHSKLCLPGVEFAGGSLGIGLGVAVGMAYAAKMDRRTWNTYCLVGDAECYEGAIWEAAMLAGHLKLHNLIVIIDRNRLGVTGFTEDLLKLEPMKEKWEAFGWETRTVNGHSIHDLLQTFDEARTCISEKPLAIIANTTKGYGVDFMSDAPLYHGIPPKHNDVASAYKQLEDEN